MDPLFSFKDKMIIDKLTLSRESALFSKDTNLKTLKYKAALLNVISEN
jgi:hypothetical protein